MPIYRRMLVLGALAGCVLVLAGTAVSAQASPTIYTVGTTEDLTGTCPEPATDKCSLRQLIEYDDEHPTPESEIVVPAGDYKLEEHGPLRITQPMVIVGAGARTTHVDRAVDTEPDRIFSVEPPSSESAVVIEGLEVSGGEVTDGAEGGDIFNRGTLLLFEDWITEGTASYGGGVYNDEGVLVIERSLVSGNLGGEGPYTNGEGGGVESRNGADGKAAVDVEDATVAGNKAEFGGGIAGAGPEDDEEPGNEIEIIDSTVAGNEAEEYDGDAAGGGVLARDSAVRVAGSIVALNTVKLDGESTDGDCATYESGTIKTLEIPSYNLESGTECGFDLPGELQNTDPEFSSAEPQDNGGNTNTLAPKPTSPAVNAIPTSFPFCNGTDQRGVTRPQGPGCDIGAVELEQASSKEPEEHGPAPAAPTVSDVRVVSVTATSATLGFTIDPDGAETTYVVDYGPTSAYGQETERVNIGSARAEQSLTRTITGLEPNHTYHFQVVASNALAATGARSSDVPFTTAGLTLAQLPAPVLGKTLNIAPVKGTVLIALPEAQAGGAAGVSLGGMSSQFAVFAGRLAAFASLSKGLHFVPLTEARQVPVGSVLETVHGVVAIESATSKAGKLQEGDFSAGVFKMLQARKQKGLTELDIMDTLSAHVVCATIGKRASAGGGAVAAGHVSSKTLGRLNASAHGKFTTRGQYSAATVRGTQWSVANQCDGTLTHVKRGVVSVRDFVTRKTITLFTGQSYLARP